MLVCVCTEGVLEKSTHSLASSSGHSQLFVVSCLSRETTKSWEWPGDEATHSQVMLLLYSQEQTISLPLATITRLFEAVRL